MTRMFDSINISSIPSDATEILAYTDGMYANVEQAKARFPNARIHTISAVGSVPGEWIDVEAGCVWPPNRAVDLWHSWIKYGCRGFYCSISLQPTIRGLLAPGDNPEWFDANYTGVDHVDPGDVATQWTDAGPYDISETTPAFDGDPPAPAPTHPEEYMKVVEATNPATGVAAQYLIRSTDVLHVPDPTCSNWAYSEFNGGQGNLEAVPWEVILWLNKGQTPT